jgi:solute carrier family 30 (zinc transporter), member 1
MVNIRALCVFTESSSQLNMRGVFLHVLGDALGSVVVIVSALIIKFVDGDWKYYVDPAMRQVVACLSELCIIV